MVGNPIVQMGDEERFFAMEKRYVIWHLRGHLDSDFRRAAISHHLIEDMTKLRGMKATVLEQLVHSRDRASCRILRKKKNLLPSTSSTRLFVYIPSAARCGPFSLTKASSRRSNVTLKVNFQCPDAEIGARTCDRWRCSPHPRTPGSGC